MRLAEKTIELNFCAQLNAWTKQRLVWFGLTQKQEARAGFDACTKMGRRLVIIQIKASGQTVRGCRRFYAEHTQMDQLRKRCKSYSRSIFYAFPLIGTTSELSTNPDFITQTWLLDVAQLPVLPAPTTTRGTLRKNGAHYIDVIPGHAVIHSDPIEVSLLSSAEVTSNNFGGADGVDELFRQDFEAFWAFRQLLAPTSTAIIT